MAFHSRHKNDHDFGIIGGAIRLGPIISLCFTTYAHLIGLLMQCILESSIRMSIQIQESLIKSVIFFH